MSYTIKNAVSSSKVPLWGNQKKYIAIHYLGVVGQSHDLANDGCGAHYYIYWDGTIYQRCSHDAIVWAVGTGGYYTQKHATARNSNTISIEMCCKCDGDKTSAEDKRWYFTEETQEACVWLVRKLMQELNISEDHVLRHYDIVNKTCPAPYVHNNKYKTSWTWDEFKAKVANKEIVQNTLYRVRKSWEDEKSQIFAGTLSGAKSACKSGYSVFDEKGNVVYSINSASDNVDQVWLGWVKRESGNDGFKQTNGDNGHAFGKYQFDNRYALVPFMQYCVDYNKTRYSAFSNYIAYGVGSSKLVGNKNLATTWLKLCTQYPDEFEKLQDTYAYNYYYLEAKKYIKNLYGINMDNHSPAVKGTLFSMAIRSGALVGAKKFDGCTDATSDAEMLRIAYSKYGNEDAKRWTKAGQWGDAIKALNNNEYTEILKTFGDQDTSVKPYRVGTAWKSGSCVNQVGAYDLLDNAKKQADATAQAKKKTYYVFDANGSKLYTAKYTSTTTTSSSYSKTQFVKDVQKAIGAVVDGVAGNETMSKVPVLSKTSNSKHGAVKPLQTYLKSLGYVSIGDADGIFGSKTDSCVKQFQKNKNLTADGIVGSNTWSKLLK